MTSCIRSARFRAWRDAFSCLRYLSRFPFPCHGSLIIDAHVDYECECDEHTYYVCGLVCRCDYRDKVAATCAGVIIIRICVRSDRRHICRLINRTRSRGHNLNRKNKRHDAVVRVLFRKNSNRRRHWRIHDENGRLVNARSNLRTLRIGDRQQPLPLRQ